MALQGRIYSLRTRLRSLGITDLTEPAAGMYNLPSSEQCTAIATQLDGLVEDTKALPSSVPDSAAVGVDLRSLRTDLHNATDSMARVDRLAKFRAAVENCDNALSDLLEHIDSYPSPPMGALSSTHVLNSSQPPEEQIGARLRFTEDLVKKMRALYEQVKDDARAHSEYDRVEQTWQELQAMCQDLLTEQRVRPPSVISNSRSNHTSLSTARPGPVPISIPKKATGYSKLSAGSTSQLLAPPLRAGRRSSSGPPNRPPPSRSSSRMSMMSVASTSRSVSNPAPSTTPVATSRLYQSTFASRQRTQSTASPTSMVTPPPKPGIQPKSRPRSNTSHATRTASPAFSEVSTFSQSRSSLNLSRASHYPRARVPRQSFSSLSRATPPLPRTSKVRKPYVANPKSKLDMAVGEVVNKLPINVDINVEVVAETWKDQSGKYWIGSQDPKLCFCRILRSQMVMVRVGGGWTELSKYVYLVILVRIVTDSSI